MKLQSIIWFALAAIAASSPISFIKLYTENGDMRYIVASIVSYLFLIYALTIVLKDGDITVLYPLLKIITILCVVFSGVILFKNKIDTKAILGILLAVAAIYLLTNKTDK